MACMTLFIRSGETEGRTDKSERLHADRASTNELLHPPQISFSRRGGGLRKVDFLRGGAYRNCTARWLGPPSVTSPVKTSRKSKCSISENIFSLANVT